MPVFSVEKLTRWINTGKQVFVRYFVVAVNAVTAGHRGQLFKQDQRLLSETGEGRGVWVPALAGTTAYTA
jgi:hypothetical protein